MGSSIMRAIGDSRRPLIYLVICCVINIILDILFVIVFHMGIAGAAIATVISQGVSAILVTRSLMKSYGILKLELRAIRFHGALLKSELRSDCPAAFSPLATAFPILSFRQSLITSERIRLLHGLPTENLTPSSGQSADHSALRLLHFPVRISVQENSTG